VTYLPGPFGSRRDFSRRSLLRIGGLTSLSFELGLGEFFGYQRLMAAAPGSHRLGTAQACILIWLDGGPSHLETFDPKPEAPAEVRGPLGSIATPIAGVRLGECLPRTADRMRQLAIIRSLTSPLGEHNFGTHYLMTGYQPTPALEYPTLGAVVAHQRQTARTPPPESSPLPAHMAIPNFQVGGGRLSGRGYLPNAVTPFAVGGDPARPDFKVRDLALYHGLDLSRLQRRTEFVAALDRFSPQHASVPIANTDLERAYNLLASPAATQAFDLNQEPASVRQRYGGKSIGQSCLLARRLVEAGVPFITVNNTGWDTHADLETRLKSGFTGATVGVGLIPSLDLALAALIDDLQDRRLLDQTLIVVMGEFGRTPKLNTQGGRDHWPRVFSALLAGGGVAGGQVIGSSDATGETPLQRAVTPSDLVATIYSLLGIDPFLDLHTDDGRPVRVVPAGAELIPELLS